jgi:hypothetical protein
LRAAGCCARSGAAAGPSTSARDKRLRSDL